MSTGSILRKMPAGLILIMLSIGIMAIGSAVASALSKSLVIQFNLTPPSNPTYQLINNITASSTAYTLTIPDENGTYKLVVNGVNGTSGTIYIYTDGNYTFTWGGTSGTWRAQVNITGLTTSGTPSSSTGTYDYAAKLYIYNTNIQIILVSSTGTTAESVQYVLPNDTIKTVLVYWQGNTNSNTSGTTLDLGFIPGLAVVFGGLYMFLRGLRMVTRTRI